MSKSTKRPDINKPDYSGGLRDVRTTGVFRAINFELFAKPVIPFLLSTWKILEFMSTTVIILIFSWQNKYVMAFGLLAITGCVAYIAYMNAETQNRKEATYVAITDDGSEKTTVRKSKWDFWPIDNCMCTFI